MFCKLCHIGVYKPTDTIDLQRGGVLLRGGVTELAQNTDNLEVPDDDESNATSRRFTAKSKQTKQVGELAKSIGLQKNI